jgi:hypothetical protein
MGAIKAWLLTEAVAGYQRGDMSRGVKRAGANVASAKRYGSKCCEKAKP